MRKLLLTTLYLLLPTFVFAAGGGGGGGGGSAPPPPPPCDADTWICTDWSSCSEAGVQTRSCRLTGDCLSVETPQPQEIQICAPPAQTPPPEEFQSGEPASAPPQPPPACTEDLWTCIPWGACNKLGHQTRTCKLTKDCRAAVTPKPFTDRICPGIKCGHLSTLLERIRCRLQLDPGAFTLELSIQYAPELCRAQTTSAEFAECTELYRALAPCWNEEDGAPRITCAKRTLGLLEDLPTAKATCLAKKDLERTHCLEEFKEKIIWLTLFRMYNLEVAAELLISRGAPWEKVAEFDAQVEKHKIAFYKDGLANAERIKILKSLQAAWRLFIKDVSWRLQ